LTIAELSISDELWRRVEGLYRQSFGHRYVYVGGGIERGLVRSRYDLLVSQSQASATYVEYNGDAIVGFTSCHLLRDGTGVITTPAITSARPEVLQGLTATAERFLMSRSVRTISVRGISPECVFSPIRQVIIVAFGTPHESQSDAGNKIV
jgi:hypothetical protein